MEEVGLLSREVGLTSPGMEITPQGMEEENLKGQGFLSDGMEG